VSTHLVGQPCAIDLILLATPQHPLANDTKLSRKPVNKGVDWARSGWSAVRVRLIGMPMGELTNGVDEELHSRFHHAAESSMSAEMCLRVDVSAQSGLGLKLHITLLHTWILNRPFSTHAIRSSVVHFRQTDAENLTVSKQKLMSASRALLQTHSFCQTTRLRPMSVALAYFEPGLHADRRYTSREYRQTHRRPGFSF